MRLLYFVLFVFLVTSCTKDDVENKPPVVSAGADITITLAKSTDSVRLTGSATDPDGTVAGYQWTLVSGPTTPTIATPGSPVTYVKDFVSGTYVFQLAATDDKGATGIKTIQVKVTVLTIVGLNRPPLVNAGLDQTITLNYATDSIRLTGSATDPDGTVVAYLWSQVSGPGTSTITSPGSPTTYVKGLSSGTYVFQLMATDDKGATGVDTITVKVNIPLCTEKGSWVGSYVDGYTGTVNTVNNTSFINNGVAQLTNSPWSYFYSNVTLSLPACRVINADTVRLEVSLKNPSTAPNSIADYDVGLTLLGSQDTASVIYIGYRSQFTKLGLTKKSITNSTNLLYIFENFTTVTLEAKDNVLSSTRGGTLTESLSYAGYSIGLLKAINISFKGSGSVDWVKIYSSKSNTLLMQEDFNQNGTSNIIWY